MSSVGGIFIKKHHNVVPLIKSIGKTRVRFFKGETAPQKW